MTTSSNRKGLLFFSLMLILCFIPSCNGGSSSSSGGGSPQGIDNDADQRRDLSLSQRKDAGSEFSEDREVRTYNGSGNNTEYADWGASFIALQRFTPVNYGDGISTLSGEGRPSARVVSNQVSAQAEGESIPNSFGTSDFLWQWGQFIDHDLDLTDGVEEGGANARANDILIPAGDPFFDPQGTGQVVISFNRARFISGTGTDRSNPRQQENEITAWIDASHVYGSDQERVNALRVGPDSPFLKMTEEGLLPLNSDGLTNANGPVRDPSSLFIAGDVRVNEQVALAAMHTLFVREHNRLAAILQERNPNRSAEGIFQSARRMVIAEIQKITYQEFLPALIGNVVPKYSGYKSDINPSIFNEFSVAAFRLGHSMLSPQILRLDSSGNAIPEGHLSLRNAFFSAPTILTSVEDLDPIFRGLARQHHQRIDVKVISDVRNFLFGQPGSGGLDLVSLNIQRGRDHGVSSYNDAREALGLSRATSFRDITRDSSLQTALSETYGSVDNIDLWVGGLAEDSAGGGSQVGPLFQTIIGIQFSALRDGDRFWYSRDLSAEELELVEGMKLSNVIRANTGVGSELQDYVFRVP